mmetsp:Transcript_10307/g.16098  ORF Transcript_10307/g.16098 Transcript_10307/m.16098 type:complete len:169 (-) Transcript_10307:11-517(-)
MERHYGWDGICVEPQVDQQWFLAHRRCKLINAVVGSHTDEQVQFANSGWCGAGCAGIKANAEASGTRTVPTVTLSKLLRDHRAPAIVDFLSVDVEGAEDRVFEGFPFETHTVLVMTIETQNTALLDMLRGHGYVVVAILKRSDVVLVHPSIPSFDWIRETFPQVDKLY